jgi:hypothetical protein
MEAMVLDDEIKKGALTAAAFAIAGPLMGQYLVAILSVIIGAVYALSKTRPISRIEGTIFFIQSVSFGSVAAIPLAILFSNLSSIQAGALLPFAGFVAGASLDRWPSLKKTLFKAISRQPE